MTKYRLTDDIDLGFNPNEPRDAKGRWTKRVDVKAPAYMVNGKSFDALGKPLPLRAAGAPSADAAIASLRPVAPKRASSNPADAFLHRPASPSLKPVAPKSPAAPSKPASVGESLWSRLAQPGVDTNAIARKIIEETGLSNDTDKENLSSDMGLNPKLAGKSIRELRKIVKARTTSGSKRAEAKDELVKRVAMKKAVEDERNGFTNKLARRFEDAPEGADLAPIIGETLAAHPKLGPLAHLWDRLRLAGYNTKKHVTSKEFGDELPRILARSAVNVLIALVAIHLGMGIPGLVPGAGG